MTDPNKPGLIAKLLAAVAEALGADIPAAPPPAAAPTASVPVGEFQKFEDQPTLRLRDDGAAHTPFPYDVNALGSLRPDQVPRFFAALTDYDSLDDGEVPLDSLVAMQDRVDPAKVESMRAAKSSATPPKRPVVVQMNGRNYIADGHHRATAAFLDGERTLPVKIKNIEPVSSALKMEGKILKVDDEQRMVYGWATVITEKGQPVVDSQGDVIEPAELVKATTEFMKSARVILAMHERDADGEIQESMHKGVMVHSFPLTYEIAKSMGIETDREGWMVGCFIKDDEAWAAVKSGELPAFSIGGAGVRQPIEV